MATATVTQQQQQQGQQQAAGYATVKSVPTGDTVVLMGRAAKGPPPELQLSLSGVIAPRLARGPSMVDEPFAWEAREYLRKLVLGKPVQFRQEATAKGGRAYGSVWIASPAGGAPESAALNVVRAGWCVTSSRQGGNAASSGGATEAALDPVATELAAAESEARDARRGVHSTDGAARQAAVRQVKWSVDASTVAEKYGGRPARAIVEYVKDGSNLRCMIVPDMCVANVSLAGVRCGRVNRPSAAQQAASEAATEGDAPPSTPQPEPFAEEAKFFVESRLLNREVEIGFASIDKFGNALCTVTHTAGVIAVELLKHGLGKVSEPGLAGVDVAEAARLREAEKQAKAAKLRLWRGYEAPQVTGVKEHEFDALVVEAISGDQVSVQRWGDEAGAEMRLALSSVRAPRMPNPRAARSGEPWGVEAREALRKLTVGKRCRVKIEYARDIPTPGAITSTSSAPDDAAAKGSASQTRVFASLTLAGSGPKPTNGQSSQAATRDVAEILVGEGLLAVVLPRSSEERAERFDNLAAAEKQAKARKVGTHSGKQPAPPAKIADLAGDAKRARAFLPYLKRQKSHKAFVETVFTGSRVKLRFSGENCAVVFSLSACRSPAPASASRPEAEAGGDAARSFARRTLLQRTVEAAVDDMDRNGVALGSLTLLDVPRSAQPPPESAASYESRLLSRGLAKLDRRRMEQQLPGSELGQKYRAWADLEEAARARRDGLWADEANVTEFETADDAAKRSASGQALHETRWPAKLADIVDGSTFYVHELGAGPDDVSRFDAVAARMRAFRPPAPVDDDRAKKLFRRGATVAALFDGEWCRAKILEGAGTSFKLRYVDYGNVELGVEPDRLRPLDPALASMTAAALECELAYVAVAPVDDEPGDQAARALHELAWDRPLVVCQHAAFNEPDKNHKRRVVLRLQRDAGADGGDDNDVEPASINERLVDMGLARVPRAAKQAAQATNAGPSILASLLDLEQQARSRRTGLWRWGDIDYSDDEN
ncbi:hypothetical protein CTAYLR_007898 [Chrysophaeum taylorii]|uniref:Uncharacterized protein n=1 Tax=Chrysophaeum taylorii TaxID=2483200 RepID=A0AAD7UN13_9STRA|nr:hypothetical protein CTAYLR_007898 [Chrysophaeum taylorii]